MSGLKQGRKTRFFANLAESCLKCDICDARFWIQSKLDKHYATHIQIELSCKICEATFLEYTDLDQHYAIHKPLNTEHVQLLKHAESTHLDDAYTQQHKNPTKTFTGKSGAGFSRPQKESISDRKIAQAISVSNGMEDLHSRATESEQDRSRAQKTKSILKATASVVGKKESLMRKEPLVSSTIFPLSPEAQSSNDHDSENKGKKRRHCELEFASAKRRNGEKIQVLGTPEPMKKLSIDEYPDLVSRKTKSIMRIRKNARVALNDQMVSEREGKNAERVASSKRTLQNVDSKELGAKLSTIKILQVDNGKFTEVISDQLRKKGQMQAIKIPVSRPVTDYGISPSSNFPFQISPVTLNQISSAAEQFEDKINLKAPLTKELSLKGGESSKTKMGPEVSLFVVTSQSKHTRTGKSENLKANESPKTATTCSLSNSSSVDFELGFKTSVKKVICFNDSSELTRGINLSKKEDKVSTGTQLYRKKDCQLFKKKSPVKKPVLQRSLTPSHRSSASKLQEQKLGEVSVMLRRLGDSVVRECLKNGYISLRDLSQKTINASLEKNEQVSSVFRHRLETMTNTKKNAAANSSASIAPKNVKMVTVSSDFMTKLKESFLPKSQSGGASQIRLVIPPQVLNTLQEAQKKERPGIAAQNLAFKVQTSPVPPCPTQSAVASQSSKTEVSVNRSKISSPVTPSEMKKVAMSRQPEVKRPSQSRVIVYGVEDMRRDDQRRREHREKMDEKERMLKKMLAKFEEKEMKKVAKYRVKRVARLLKKKTHQLNAIQEKLIHGGEWKQWELLKELERLSSGESALEIAELFRSAGFETLEEKMGIEKSYHLFKKEQKQKESSKVTTAHDVKSLEGNQARQKHVVLSESSTSKLPVRHSPKKTFPSVYHLPPTENDSLNSSTIKYSPATKRRSRASGKRGLSRVTKNSRLGPVNRVQPSRAIGRGKCFGEDPFTDLSMITDEKYILECPCNKPFCNLPHLAHSC